MVSCIEIIQDLLGGAATCVRIVCGETEFSEFAAPGVCVKNVYKCALVMNLRSRYHDEVWLMLFGNGVVLISFIRKKSKN